MIKNKIKDDMLVEEHQYRAVITKVKGGWSASVQRRIGINEWKKVRCGLKGLVLLSRSDIERLAKQKIRQQKSLDDNINAPTSYIIYDD